MSDRAPTLTPAEVDAIRERAQRIVADADRGEWMGKELEQARAVLALLDAVYRAESERDRLLRREATLEAELIDTSRHLLAERDRLAARLGEQAALVEAAVAMVAAEVAEHAAVDDMDAACRLEDQAMTYDEWRPARDRLNATVASLEAVRATRKVKQESLLVEARAYHSLLQQRAEPGVAITVSGPGMKQGEGQGG